MMDYKIVEACECCIKCKGKVLLQHRSELNSHYPGFYCFPGGSVDNYEDSILGVVREVKEETGMTLDEKKLKLVVNESNYHEDDKELWNISTFFVELDDFAETVISDEGTLEWIEIDKAKDIKLVPQTKLYFDHAVNPNGKILYMIVSYIKDEIVKIISEKYI